MSVMPTAMHALHGAKREPALERRGLAGLPSHFRHRMFMHEDGCLLWNAPDIGPAPEHAVLFHEPNRRLRRRVLELLEQPSQLHDVLARVPHAQRASFANVVIDMEQARNALTLEARRDAQMRAERQVLPLPTQLATIRAQAQRYFAGAQWTRSFEMLATECLDAILIPSNQRVLSEIADRAVRQRITELVMRYDVLPALHASAARTTDGHAVQWTFGEYERVAMPSTHVT